MKNKLSFIILFFILLVCVAPSATADILSDEAFSLLDKTTVIRSEDSPTGYYVTFRHKDPEAVRVRIRGEWSFSSARTSTTKTYNAVMPDSYQPGMFPMQLSQDTWPIVDMTLDETTGIWHYTIPLPCGVWNYRFIVGGSETGDPLDCDGALSITDPNNPPVARGEGQQTNSQVYVPFDPERQDMDFSVQAKRTDGKVGTLEIIPYDASSLTYELLDEPAVAVYLPYGYDENREEPYKVLYASHGAGIESETSWWNKGVIGNITDNLIADAGIEPFVIVMMNNYADSFDHHNLLNNIIPLIEQRYNVRNDTDGMAICGISKGAILAKNILLDSPETFRYYGLFSGGYFSESSEQFDPERISSCRIYLASGERELGLPAICRTIEKLVYAGKTDLHMFTIMGGHNWYVWRQIYADFVMNELWK